MADAIIGRYRIRVEEAGMVLTHPTGISFDITANEALGLYDLISIYRKTLQKAERDTEPEIKRIIVEEPPQES